jgi:hypothetical protein
VVVGESLSSEVIDSPSLAVSSEDNGSIGGGKWLARTVYKIFQKVYRS